MTVLTATAHITPAESRALARAVGRIVGYLIRELGWGWGVLTALGALGLGWAAWTASTWWPFFRDWLEQ